MKTQGLTSFSLGHVFSAVTQDSPNVYDSYTCGTAEQIFFLALSS